MTEPEIRIVKVPMHDTGIGQEAGYRNDREMIDAYHAKREELRAFLTPEAFARLEAAEREEEDRFLRGDR